MLGLMGPKKMAAIIIGGHESASEDKAVDLKKEAQLDSAKEIFKALEKKDAQAFVDSFKLLLEHCAESEGDSEEKKE
jgi:hypothetical protein